MERIVPNFFIIGGPKCGTTSLAAYLDEHQNVFISNPKEPFFFSTDLSFGIKDWDEYNACFSELSHEHKAIGDASVDYLFSNNAVVNILKVNPSAKFIVMVRNPVDMAYSLHSQLLWSGIESISDFQEAFSVGELDRKKGLFWWFAQDQMFWLQYKKVCSLGWQLERLYSIVPSEQVMVIVFDDLINDVKTVYRRALDFIGVEQDQREIFPIYNENKMNRARILTLMTNAALFLKKKLFITKSFGIADKILFLNTKNKQRASLAVDVHLKLAEEFRDDVTKLSSMLDRDFCYWLEPRYRKNNEE